MPDRVETRLGTLQFTDGFPDDATVEKVFDNLDFQHAVQAFLTTMPAASLVAMPESVRGLRSRQSDRDHLRVVDGLAIAVSHREYRKHLRDGLARSQERPHRRRESAEHARTGRTTSGSAT